MKNAFLLLAIFLACSLSCTSKKQGDKMTTGIPNPIHESNEEEILEKIGVRFSTPKNAKDIKFSIIAESMAQMSFTLDNAKCFVRIMPSPETELNDISGFYYNWTEEHNVKVGYNDAKVKLFSKDNDVLGICIWWDIVPGIMYSVSMDKNASVENLTNLSNEVYIQLQGNSPESEQNPNTTQNHNSIKDFQIQEINPIKYIVEKFNLTQMNSIYAHSKLYVLGFSQTGKIAYIEAQNFEGVGEFIFLFYIQDLVSDKIFYHFSKAESELEYGKQSVKDFLVANSEEFDKVITQHKIILENHNFNEFPFRQNHHVLNVSADVKDTGRKMHELFQISDYTLTAINEIGKQKTLHLQKDVPVENVFVCGYVKSPFENRLAIIIAEQRFGFEGFDLHYHIVGSNLSFE
ncbi:MAG: hypothetical protein IJR49_00460 [Treponema sp.]|nr:hypothetical protein [Treponema sp.]